MAIFEDIELDPRLDITLAVQLKQQLIWLIANGVLKPGEQLPPVQEMARQLGINLHTVRSTYHKLAAEGLVDSRQGRGTHVLTFDPALLGRVTGAARSHTIGLIIPSWNNPFYHALLQGIEEIAEQDQALLFLCNSHDDLTLARRDAARLAAKQVDGILVASHPLCQVIQPAAGRNSRLKHLPVVSIDSPGCAGYSVLIDLHMAGYQAAQHLVEHGHKRIGLITTAVDAENVIPVNRGYAQALQEHGLAPDPALVVRVPGFDFISGAEGARRFLALDVPPTAVFAITDLMALGAMQAFKQAGLQIPGDIALVGFNDILTASLVAPALTSVAAPTVQVGREAMKMLHSLIAGEQPPQLHITLPTSLVVRESCGCPRRVS